MRFLELDFMTLYCQINFSKNQKIKEKLKKNLYYLELHGICEQIFPDLMMMGRGGGLAFFRLNLEKI